MGEARHAAVPFSVILPEAECHEIKPQLTLGIRPTVSLHPFRDRAVHRARPMPEPPPVTSTALLAQSIPDISLISDDVGMLAIEQCRASVVR